MNFKKWFLLEIDSIEELPEMPDYTRNKLDLTDRNINLFHTDQSQIKHPRKNKNVNVRWMIRRDIPEILNLLYTQKYKRSEIKPDQQEFNEKTEKVLKDLLAQINSIGMVAENRDDISKIVGYMVYDLLPNTIVLKRLAALNNNIIVFEAMFNKLTEKLKYNKENIILDIKEDFQPDVGKWLNSIGWIAQPIPGSNQVRFTYNKDVYPDKYNYSGEEQ